MAEAVPGQASPAPFSRLHSVSDAEKTTVTLQAGYGVHVMCPLSMGVDTIAALTRAIGHQG